MAGPLQHPVLYGHGFLAMTVTYRVCFRAWDSVTLLAAPSPCTQQGQAAFCALRSSDLKLSIISLATAF